MTKNNYAYGVQKDDSVVMASDGYPRLFDTFENTEEYLQNALENAPMCTGLPRRTKGVQANEQIIDDRTYVSFIVS